MRHFSCLGAVACLVAFALPLTARLPIGSIAGIAQDPSGRVVVGAHVVATEEHQGFVREGLTNSDGAFTLSNNEPGSFTVVLTAPGFSEVRYSDVQVAPGQAVTLN